MEGKKNLNLQEAQALLGQVREALSIYFKWAQDVDRQKHKQTAQEALQALDQLSAHLAEQEKAVRVKVLEEVRDEIIVHEEQDFNLRLINQKLKEARG